MRFSFLQGWIYLLHLVLKINLIVTREELTWYKIADVFYAASSCREDLKDMGRYKSKAILGGVALVVSQESTWTKMKNQQRYADKLQAYQLNNSLELRSSQLKGNAVSKCLRIDWFSLKIKLQLIFAPILNCGHISQNRFKSNPTSGPTSRPRIEPRFNQQASQALCAIL